MASKTCKYFQELEEVLGEKPCLKFVVLASSLRKRPHLATSSSTSNIYNTTEMDNAVLRRKRLISLAIITSHNFLQFSLSVTNNSDSDEETNNILMARHRSKLRSARIKPLRIEGYVERTVQGLTAKQFREHFRMIPNTYEILEAKLGLLLSKESDSGRAIIPVRKQLLSTLWLLATLDSYR